MDKQKIENKTIYFMSNNKNILIYRFTTIYKSAFYCISYKYLFKLILFLSNGCIRIRIKNIPLIKLEKRIFYTHLLTPYHFYSRLEEYKFILKT